MVDAFDVFNSRFLQANFNAAKQAVDVSSVRPSAAIGQAYQRYGVSTEVPLRSLVEYYKRSLKFKLAVITYMSRSVGMGFYNTADVDTRDGKKGLEIINDFCEDWNLDEKNQLGARDAWMSGNFFWNKVTQGEKKVQGIFMLPLSSFVKINRDADAKVLSYTQLWGGNQRDLPADQIMHFRWLPIDENAYGEGIGQSLARSGVGYENEAGNTVIRPSWFEIEEKVDDVAHRYIYAGLPRYFAKFPGADADFISDANDKMNKLDPLQHFISSVDGDIKSVSLDTQSRHDSFIRHITDAVTTGTQSPLIRLWSSLDFTYASANQAVAAMDPTIDMYQRAHKRFVEKNLYYPLLEQEGLDPKKAAVRLIWGQQTPPTVEQITQLMSILNTPTLIQKYNPDDIIGMLQEAGFKLTSVVEKEIKDTTGDLQDIGDFEDTKGGDEELAAKLEKKKSAEDKKKEAPDAEK